mgnify:CR=1 FL=1
MAKLYFKFGAMGSSKSAQALMTKFNYEEKNKNENNSSNTSSGYVRGSEYYGGKK